MSASLPDNSQAQGGLSAPAPVSLAQAVRYWFKLGCISFGGPAGQIAIMHHDLVEQQRWISEKRFLHALNYCMLLPGPEAQQLATYIGWLMHRGWGGVLAGGLFVLPAFFMLVALGWLYMAYGQLPAVAGALYAVKPAVVAIVVFAAYRIGSRTLKHPLLWLMAALAFIAIFLFKWPFPAIVFAAAGLGMLASKWVPQAFVAGGHAASAARAGSAWIDDDTPPPPHARFQLRRLLATLAIGLLFTGGVLLGLAWTLGKASLLTQMGWFFSKAALLTFGGAYAVLPYVYQGAVETYHWLSAPQMMDALALGETTPGPLIMVVTFVGFVGGWLHPLTTLDSPLLSAFLAALLVTWVTFLPSFIFIFAGAPLIESSRDNLRLTAPLTAITAAVVGVIVNLALFFAYHVFVTEPAHSDTLSATVAATGYRIDFCAVALSLLAWLALTRGRQSVLRVVVCFAALGVVGQWGVPLLWG